MATTSIQQTTAAYQHTYANPVAKFFSWSAAQNGNRLLWIGIILAAHGCILTPLTVMATFLGGTVNITLIVLAIVAMGMALVSNLAAQPTKVTIPVFVLSVLIDLGIMIAAVATAL
jgi:hypothetical protein